MKVEDKKLLNKISTKNRIEILEKLLIVTNSTDYSSIILSLNNSLSTNVFLSYYLATKYQPALENGILKSHMSIFTYYLKRLEIST